MRVNKISFSWDLKNLQLVFVLIFLLLFWQWLVSILRIPEYIFPAPSQVALKIIQKHQYLMRHSLVTLSEILAGFTLGMSAAFILSLGILYSKTIEKVIYPLLLFIQVTPKVAVAPLFLIWFGFGLLPKIIISALVSFFPLVINTVRGLKSVDSELVDLMHSLSATKRQMLIQVRIPSSLPYVFVGLKVSVTLSVIGAVVGEFVGASKGLGYVIIIANSNLETSLVFACLVILSIIGIGLFGIICLIEFRYSWRQPLEINI